MTFPKLGSHKPIAVYIATVISLTIIYALIFIYLATMEHQTDHANLLTGVYWVISSMTTVGYGDVTLTSNPGMIFSILVQVSGVVMIFGLLFPLVVIPWLERTMMIKMPTHAPEGMTDHIIICGYNRIVETLIDELKDRGISFIIVEDDEHLIHELMEKDIPCVFGSSSDEQVLENASIDAAKIVITNKSDEENANIVLTAREFTDVEVIAIIEDTSKAKYLKYAGASKVVSPKSLIGRFIGKKAVDPFVNRLTGTTEFFEGVSIVEFPIYQKSSLIGMTLENAAIHGRTGANVVGIWKAGSLSFNPDAEYIIKDNSVLLAIGTTDQLSKLKNLTR
ncbi:MAG TPA: potassium channel protein [Methanosarcinaceae archaeon]|nr:potassium channel protein [Methanosarcinaceae archaeon]